MIFQKLRAHLAEQVSKKKTRTTTTNNKHEPSTPQCLCVRRVAVLLDVMEPQQVGILKESIVSEPSLMGSRVGIAKQMLTCPIAVYELD